MGRETLDRRWTRLLSFALTLWLMACGANGAGAPAANSPDEMPSTPASAPAAGVPPPANAPFSGPLVGFYIEDSYEDVYLSIFDVGTGGFRVIQTATPIYIGEARWFDDGCRLFVHGDLIDLHGVVEWTVPPAVAERIEQINTAELSPGRRYIAHVVVTDDGNGAADSMTEIEIVSLSPPYSAARPATAGNAPRALAWSADGAWLFYTDYDPNGILQVFRASPDGLATEQLTRHATPLGAINGLSPAPGGRYVAYGVQNLSQAGQPYTYQPANEGWVGLIDLETGTSAAVRPAKFGSAEGSRGLIWDAAGENLLIIGDSLPVGEDDPDAGRRMIWVTATGDVTRAISTADGPGGVEGHMGWIAPLGSIDTLLVNAFNDFYRYESNSGTFETLEGLQAPPLGIEISRRPLAILPAPIGFPGEATCGE